MSSTPTPDPPPESGQHDPSSGGRRNRRQGRNVRKHANREPEVDARGKISGKIDQLEGHIYDVASSSPTDSFTRTTEEIALYVSSNLDRAGEYRTGLVNMLLPPVPRPVPPEDQSDVVLAALFGEEIKMYSRALESRRNNQGKVFGIILGQCTKAMKDQIEADPNWATVNDSTDVIGLLKLIRAHSHGAQPKREASHMLLDAIQEFYGYRQEYVKDRETVIMGVSEYYQGFRERLENLERVHGPVGQDEPRVLAYMSDVMHVTSSMPNEVAIRQAKTACRERFLATTLIFHASPSKFRNLQTELQNNHVLYRSPYPNTLSEAYEILVSRLKIQEDQKRSNRRDDIVSQPSFFQDEHGNGGRGRGRGRGSGRGRNGGDGGRGTNAGDSTSGNVASPANGIANSTPSNSASTSQPVNDYMPSSPSDSTTALGISLQQHTDGSIPGTWVILDSASTIDMFVNADLLTDIRHADPPLRIISNAGNVLVHQQATLPGYPFPVWYHPGGAANVLSLYNIQKCFKVSLTPSGMTVRVTPQKVLQFVPSESGLYHFDT
jgi:hypothetical protein